MKIPLDTRIVVRLKLISMNEPSKKNIAAGLPGFSIADKAFFSKFKYHRLEIAFVLRNMAIDANPQDFCALDDWGQPTTDFCYGADLYNRLLKEYPDCIHSLRTFNM